MAGLSNFPSAIDTFTTKQDGEIHYAEHQNAIQDSVIAIEETLGIGASPGPYAPLPSTPTFGAPAWATPAVVCGMYSDGTYRAHLDWNPISSTDCIGYVVQRSITEMSSTSPALWDTLTSVTGNGNTSYTDQAGLASNMRYWYRVCGYNMGGNLGPFNTAMFGDSDSSVSVSNPDPVIGITVYLDASCIPTASWSLPSFNFGNNYFECSEVIVSGSADPTDTSNVYYHKTEVAYPSHILDLYSLWSSSEEKPSLSSTLYVHIRTRNVWTLTSTWKSSSGFSLTQMLSGYTAFQGSAWSNFKLLLENHYYTPGGEAYVFNPADFAVAVPNLKYIGNNIAAGTIQTQALAVGSGQRAFDIIGVEFHPNDDGDDATEDEEDWGYLRVTTSKAIPTLQMVRSTNAEEAEDIYVWVVNKFEGVTLTPHPNQTGVSKKYEPSEQTSYYVYFKCNKTNDQDCEIVLVSLASTGGIPLPPDGAKHASANGYYWFLAGIWDVAPDRDGRLGMSYGFTFIDGNHITTGKIDCNYVKVHGANGDVVIDGNNITVTNGKMNFSTEGEQISIDATGIKGEGTNSSFSLTNEGGLQIKAGTGSQVHVDGDGIWTGTGKQVNSVWMHDKMISVYNAEGGHECTFGKFDTNKYGLLAGASVDSGPRAELTKTGLNCYNSSNQLIFSTEGSGFFNGNFITAVGLKCDTGYSAKYKQLDSSNRRWIQLVDDATGSSWSDIIRVGYATACDTAANATNAENAEHATNADNSNKLGNVEAGLYALKSDLNSNGGGGVTYCSGPYTLGGGGTASATFSGAGSNNYNNRNCFVAMTGFGSAEWDSGYGSVSILSINASANGGSDLSVSAVVSCGADGGSPSVSFYIVASVFNS